MSGGAPKVLGEASYRRGDSGRAAIPHYLVVMMMMVVRMDVEGRGRFFRLRIARPLRARRSCLTATGESEGR